MTSSFPLRHKAVIEDVFSNGVKKKCSHFLELAFKILQTVNGSAILVLGARSEVFALLKEIRVCVGQTMFL